MNETTATPFGSHSNAPSLSSESGGRLAYGIMLLPTVTDWVETGSLPMQPRAWLTEIVVGLLIAALVYRTRQKNRALLAMALTDALTDLGNRRAFMSALNTEAVRAVRMHKPLSLVFMDLDRFKHVNDRWGHEAGDRVLRQLAEAIRETIRKQVDHGFRLGGDEFALLLPGSTNEHAEAVIARTRERCGQTGALWREKQVGLSAGIVELAVDETIDDFIKRADAAMYSAKRGSHPPVT